MSNPLTGDFEAVLQVSGGTVNRLVASMHQNGFANPDRPSFPHSIQLRIGVDHLVDGVRGTVKVQIATPRVELIPGATDRFWIEVAVRARYVPDSGTRPLPEFMNGTVRAQYKIEDIDPHCLGWSHKASEHLWVRVIKDTVRFQGTAEDDWNPFQVLGSGVVEDHAAVEARITHQVAVLLATTFDAAPQPVSKRFRRGSLRSIGSGGDSAVVSPVGVSGDPVGNIASVGNVFLQGADFGIAMSKDVILGMADPALASIRGFSPTIKVDIITPWYSPIPDIHTVYRVSVDPPSVEWKPFGSFAVIKIKVNGSAKTDSVLPNATFSIDQDIVLNFDGGGERLFLTAGSRTVTANGSGPFGVLIEGAVKGAVETAVKDIVEAACTAAQPELDALIARKQELIGQLKTIDDHPNVNARVTDATFLLEGMILRGRISLAPRQGPVVFFEKTAEQDGFTAVKSWIPGGRIDKFQWSWGFFNGGDPGSTTLHDRFVLRRPRGGAGRWGQALLLAQPLPGLDGSGKVCLQIQGVQVNPVTGLLQAVSASSCNRYGFMTHTGIREGGGSIFVPDVPELVQPEPFPHPDPFPHPALVDLRTNPQPTSSSNTLVLYAGENLDQQVASVLRDGLNDARRTDAGLALLVLVREGQLDWALEGSLAAVRSVCEAAGLASIVSEDLGGRWAARLHLHPESGRGTWRLIGPDGNVTWEPDGPVTGEALARALDHNLLTSPVPKPDLIAPLIDITKRIGVDFLRPGGLEPVESHCPPFPLGRAGVGGTVVTFVQRGSAASEAHLRALAKRQEQSGLAAPTIVVVVDGASLRDAEGVTGQLGLDFVALADPTRSITDGFGVRVFPTTFTLDPGGTVSAIEMGVVRPRDDPKAKAGE